MSKKTVSELAKDLNVEAKDVLGHLDKLGKKRATVRTQLTEDEQEKVRDLQFQATRPEVRIGEERVKVTETGTATDTRVSANVIKRRKVASSPSADEPLPLPASFEGDDTDGALPPPPAEFFSEELPPLPPEPEPEPVTPPIVAEPPPAVEETVEVVARGEEPSEAPAVEEREAPKVVAPPPPPPPPVRPAAPPAAKAPTARPPQVKAPLTLDEPMQSAR